MFLEYYGLREQPFGVTPNPRYLYHSPMHREALASLIYGIEADLGFAALIAEPGTGKTTLLFYLLEKFRETARTALIFQTLCSPLELLRYLANELEIDTRESDPVVLNEQIKQVLVREAQARRRVIVIIDEAQNLEEPVLETIRLLSDFETQSCKLLHIILAGQTQLAEKLARPSMAQLLQRVSMLNRLNPLTPEETRNYIEYRLKVAGYSRSPLFTPEAMQLIAKMSGGTPRKINRICFNALSLGCAVGKRVIDGEVINEVRSDLDIGDLLYSKGAIADEVRNPAAARPAVEAHCEGESIVTGFAPTIIPVAVPREAPERPADPVVVSRAASVVQAQSVPARAAFSPVKPPSSTATIPAGAANRAVASPVAKPRINPMAEGGRPAQSVAARNSASRGQHTRSSRPMLLAIAGVVAAVLALAGWTLLVKAPAVNGADANVQTPSALASAQQAELPATPATATPAQQIDNGIERGRSAARARKPQLPVKVTSHSAGGGQSSVPQNALRGFDETGRSSVESSPAARSVSAALVRKIQPVYPEDARRSGIQGSVTVSAVIGTDGKPRNVRAVSGDPILARAATDAVNQWVYEPYLVNGRPVEVETEVVVDFALR